MEKGINCNTATVLYLAGVNEIKSPTVTIAELMKEVQSFAATGLVNKSTTNVFHSAKHCSSNFEL